MILVLALDSLSKILWKKTVEFRALNLVLGAELMVLDEVMDLMERSEPNLVFLLDSTEKDDSWSRSFSLLF